MAEFDADGFDPVLSALDNAPLGEPFTPEQEAELAEDLADIRAGRARLVPHAEIGAAFEGFPQRRVG